MNLLDEIEVHLFVRRLSMGPVLPLNDRELLEWIKGGVHKLRTAPASQRLASH